jgi:hypothetical protein
MACDSSHMIHILTESREQNAAPQGKRAMASTSLLSLPRELRDLIYSFILPERIQLVQAGSESSVSFYDTNGILLASRQLRDEALDALYRLLPSTTILAPRDARVPFFGCTEYGGLGRRTHNFVIHMSYSRRNSNVFALSHKSHGHTNLYVSHVIQSMPALRVVTCEITWEPRESSAVLLPSIREHILVELKRVIVGHHTPVGWDVDCQIRDATRWKNERSGVVILRKI